MAQTDLKTVVGLFDDLGEARQAVSELKDIGFRESEVSLVANASAEQYHSFFDQEGRYQLKEGAGATEAGAGIGALLGGVAGLLAGMSLITLPGIGPILGAGPIASALMGALAGGLVGGLLGALVDMGVPQEHAGYYSEGVRRGGTLVIVRTTDAQVDQATSLLEGYHPVNVQERVSTWRQAGWNGYDPAAQPYTLEQIDEERRSHARPL